MKTKILSPLRRDGYKAGMIMMLIALSTMLLTTACSNDDDLAANNNEITNKKGFEIPVTINVTRQGDATTRASFDGSKLNFSAGDKLFVYSYNGGSAGAYAGVLDWVSDGTFSGTITTQNPYTGTIDALLSGGNRAAAVLLPAGYGDYGYLSTEGNSGRYNDAYTVDYTKAFVASTTEKTAKALAVEQFSFEYAKYSGGFALVPNNAILNFTITGLTPSTKVTATLAESGSDVISGQVTTDGSGNATFAMAIQGNVTFIKDLTLTVGGNVFSFTDSSVLLEAGNIYNITRSALTYPIALSAVTSDYIGSVVTTDGNVYPAKTAVPAGKTAVGILGKVTATGHGLILALKDAATKQKWRAINDWDSETTYAGTTLKLLTASARSPLTSYTTLGTTPTAVSVSNWAVAQKSDYEAIFTNLDSTTGDIDGTTYDANVNAYITTGVGGTAISGYYWSATERNDGCVWFFGNAYWIASNNKSSTYHVRACLAF